MVALLDALVDPCLLVAPRCAPMLPVPFDVRPVVAPPLTDCCSPLLDLDFVLDEVVCDVVRWLELLELPDWANPFVELTVISRAMAITAFFIRLMGF